MMSLTVNSMTHVKVYVNLAGDRKEQTRSLGLHEEIYTRTESCTAVLNLVEVEIQWTRLGLKSDP